MALLTATQINASATAVTPVAVSSSDTVVVDSQGIVLRVINGGGSTDNVTIADSSLTPGGNQATNVAQAVAAGTTRSFRLVPAYANPSTGQVTITHSFTTSVTCEISRVV